MFVVVDGVPVLRWQPLDEAFQYRVWVIDAGTTELMMDERTEQTQFEVTTPLIPGRIYQWLVQALGEDDALLGELNSTFTYAD